jgi:hypothetical protein
MAPKNITVSVPDELAERMKKLSDVNWSEVCRRAIASYIDIRLEPNIEAIVSRLGEERNEEYKKGYKLAYEFVREKPYTEIAKLVEGCDKWVRQEILPHLEDLSAESDIDVDEEVDKYRMQYWSDKVKSITKEEPTEAFVEGFEKGLTEIYEKSKKH